jgi:hypothetical protein
VPSTAFLTLSDVEGLTLSEVEGRTMPMQQERLEAL